MLSIAVNPATNRIVGQPYDANGNQLTGGLGYDPENRIQTAPGVQYAYDSQNKRIWRGTFDGNGNLTAQEAYFYGVGGQKLGTYALTVVQQNNQQPQLTDSNTDSAVFFGSKRVLSGGGVFIQDRLGSARRSQSGAAMSFYAYGEDKGTTQPNDQLKFASYTRDTATGLDYANQRYYANNFGKFMSPDPYVASGGVADPGSWNRYSYTRGDPINRFDPDGLADFSVTVVELIYDMHYFFFAGGGGGGGGGLSRPSLDWTDDGGGGGGQTGTSSKQDRSLLLRIQSMLDAALSNNDCADLFGKAPWTDRIFGSPTAAKALDALIKGDSNYGSIKFTDKPLQWGADAITSKNASVLRQTLPFSSGVSTVTISSDWQDGFFNTSSYNAGVVVLHELGHVLYNLGWSTKITPDLSPDGVKSQANTDQITEKCGKYLQ